MTMEETKIATDIANLPETTVVADTASVETVAPAQVSAIPADELARITDDIVSALKTVYDPEIPADIYELGLVYKIDIEDDRSVKIDDDVDRARLPGGGRDAGLGAGRRQHRRRRLRRRRQHGVRPAMDARPHVGRGAGGGGVVLKSVDLAAMSAGVSSQHREKFFGRHVEFDGRHAQPLPANNSVYGIHPTC
jgi:hypothetical protein